MLTASLRRLLDVLIFSGTRGFVLLCVGILCVQGPQANAASVLGDTVKWAPIALDFTGPEANEADTSPNPFLDYRLTVSLSSPSGRQVTLPGFFAGDGNGYGSGNHWQARFSADEVGEWKYSATLHQGDNIAVSTDLNAGTAASLDGATGSFNITAQSSTAPGFLRYGRLEYVEDHYLKFRDGPYWIKSGTDSPENMLGYVGFDGTIDQSGQFLHTFAAHRKDATSSDPQFSNDSTGADGKGLTGALNYLSSQGVNSIYFLPMNLGGDGQETFPFIGAARTRFNKTHYDISKLHQWNLVLAHAQRLGIALNIVLSETEQANEKWLDDGKLGVERKLFFRELIARFGYLLAAKWNLGEENDFPVGELRAHASYIQSLDWSGKPIAVHTQINDFSDYDEIVGDGQFSASSVQYDQQFAGQFVEQWRNRSSEAGRPWVIDMDENTNGVSGNNAATRRKQILYDVYFSGGNIEWYFGYYPLPLGGDITAGDFRQREDIWRYSSIARTFMETHLPFWRMDPMDELVVEENQTYGGAEVLATVDEVYAIYLPAAVGKAKLDLQDANGEFIQRWFNPESGQFAGDERIVKAGGLRSLGSPPARSNNDWVVLVSAERTPVVATDNSADQNDNGDAPNGSAGQDTPAETAIPATTEVADAPQPAPPQAVDGVENNALPEIQINTIPPATIDADYRLAFSASDEDGIAPVVRADIIPPGFSLTRTGDGLFELTGKVSAGMSDPLAVSIEVIDSRYSNVRFTRRFSIVIAQQSDPADDATADATTADTTPEDPPAQPQTTAAADAREPATLANDANTDLVPRVVASSLRVAAVGDTFELIVLPIDPEGIVPDLRQMDAPANSTFDDSGNGTRTFRWIPGADDIGEHALTFIATDAGPVRHVVKQDITVSVLEQAPEDASSRGTTQIVNNAPVFGILPDRRVKAGELVQFRVRPLDPEGIAPILHMQDAPEGATFNDNGDGSRTFAWQPAENHKGAIRVRFLAIDAQDSTLSASAETTITVE